MSKTKSRGKTSAIHILLMVFCALAVIAAVSFIVQNDSAHAREDGERRVQFDLSTAHENGRIRARLLEPTDSAVLLIIQRPDGRQYRFALNNQGRWNTFPLGETSGRYQVSVFEQVEGERHIRLDSINFTVTMYHETFVPLLDFDAAREQFPDIIGWIRLPGTVMNYPIMQGWDNDFYLHHLPNGAPNRHGSIFLDYRNSPDFTNHANIVYGHNTPDDSMFGIMRRFRQQDFFNENSSIFIYTPTRNYEIVLFAGYQLDSTEEVPPLRFRDEEDFDSFIADIRSRSYFHSDAEVSFEDRLVFFAVCTDRGSDDLRFILVGRIVRL